MTGEIDLGSHELRISVDEPPWAPTTVFGNVLTARHQYDAFETVKSWGYWDQVRDGRNDDRDTERDRRLVKAAGRWRGDPLQPPLNGRFVPGDVAAIRTAAIGNDLARRAQRRLERIRSGDRIHRTSEESSVALDAVAIEWLYAATPYFVGLSTLVGLVDTELPSADDLADFDLPPAVAVYFGGDIAVPLELVEADDSFFELNRRLDTARNLHANWLSGDDTPASHIDAPTISISHRRPVRVCGVVLHATPDGRLDDLVMWLTSQPENNEAQRSIIYGWVSRSMLRHVAVNLAAAVAWGQWTVPNLGADLGADPDAAEFREALRRGWFRRREPAGGAVGVRVLDVNRTVQRSADRGGTHASPTTHRRRRHWRRQRVGPRDAWRYERRLIEPVIVNPGHHPIDEPLTVYRLPLPPHN